MSDCFRFMIGQEKSEMAEKLDEEDRAEGLDN